MKISIDKMANYYSNVQNTKKPANNEKMPQTTGRNFDEILIQTSSRKVEESQFVDHVSKSLLASVTAETSEDKIDMLKNQAEQGLYRIDSGAIASKILLQEDGLHA